MISVDALLDQNVIAVHGARVHNLKNVDVTIPHGRLVAITGVSGSGKSSLAFDTIYAEGQRRYLESLSTYTRQFLDQLERPDVDAIDGLPPTLSIEQRTGSAAIRSTLATTTEISDYLRLLYARAGTAHCTNCRRPVARQTSQAIVDQILALESGRKVMILAPLVRGRKGAHRQVFEKIAREGFVRARVDGEIVDAADPPALAKGKTHEIEAVIDRIIVKDGIRSRLQESVDLALRHGEGTCLVTAEENGTWVDRLFSEKFACANCGLSFPELEPRTFSFNSPYGACPACHGLGVERADDTETADDVAGLPVCPECLGARLNAFARGVTIDGTPIHDLTALPVGDAGKRVAAMAEHLLTPGAETSLADEARRAAEKTLPEIEKRLRFLDRVGLSYLQLDRPTRTLSGGEYQRARLAACLGTGLIGVCYVLDEPTIGLHPRDTSRLIEALEELRDQGATVLVVEHDLDVIRRADWIVDIGPGAGTEGGELVAAGQPADVASEPRSVTGRFLAAPAALDSSRLRRVDPGRMLELSGARLHNLQNVTLKVPLGVLVCVTGVSGSGKSSLIAQTLVPAVREQLSQRERNVASGESTRTRAFDRLTGMEHLSRLIEIDQSPIGRSARSNPATAAGLWDEVRKVFAQTRDARIRGYTARRFSFNATEGRCPACKGQGTQRVEMQFLPDAYTTCPVCRGDRFNRATLAVRYAGRNVADVLRMRIDEAAEFFANFPRLHRLLATLHEVGLGYLELGQSALTLSGGEAQRVKLAAELGKPSNEPTLFVLDEPTTGLHPADIERLVHLLNRLIEQGHSVLVVEHQLEVIAASDWIIDLGPEGGADGGRIVAEGTPENVAAHSKSATGEALRRAGEARTTRSQ